MGEVIIEQGIQGDCFYLVGSGAVAITDKHSPDKLIERGTGDYFGELALLARADSVPCRPPPLL